MKKILDQNNEAQNHGLDISTSILFRLIRIVNLLARSFPSDHTTEHDVSLLEWRVMAVISCHPSITMTEISHYTGYGQMNVSRTVRQLISNNFAIRTTDRFDRRKNVIELTEQGIHAHKKISQGALKEESELLSGISNQDLRRLNHILNNMLEHLYDKLE